MTQQFLLSTEEDSKYDFSCLRKGSITQLTNRRPRTCLIWTNERAAHCSLVSHHKLFINVQPPSPELYCRNSYPLVPNVVVFSFVYCFLCIKGRVDHKFSIMTKEKLNDKNGGVILFFSGNMIDMPTC